MNTGKCYELNMEELIFVKTIPARYVLMDFQNVRLVLAVVLTQVKRARVC
jgi:hypothetical protein